jgi:C-terminal peptidase prc
MTRALLTSLAAVVFLAASTARAEDAKPTRYAIFIGISDYAKDSGIKSRKHGEADARALYQLFTDPAIGGVAKDNARLLLASGGEGARKATRAEMLDALKWVAKAARPSDEVLIGFFGNGGPLGDSGDRRCYFLSDSTVKGRDKDSVAAEEVEEAVKGLKARHLCVFLDIDFTGFVPDKEKPIAEPTLGKAPYREWIGDDGTDDHQPLSGRIAFLATNGLSTSMDLKEHGLFAQVLLDGLRGGAEADGFRDGYEADGLVTVDELYRYLNKKLPEKARANGKTDKEKEQEHFVLPGPGAHYVLATNPEANKARMKRLELVEELIKDGKLTGKMAEEARALLGRMPTLKKRQELRKAYQAFVDDPSKLDTLKEKRTEILASMKLSNEAADAFADKVLEVVGMVRKDYIRRVEAGKLVRWAVQGLYSAIEEKLPARIEEKLKDAERLAGSDLKHLLASARKELGSREDIENNRDLTITLQRMLANLDPHTSYFDPETKKKLDDDIGGNFTGIGVQIRKDLASDCLLVVTPIKGSPAYKAGLWAGDIITRIKREVDSNGKPITDPEQKDLSTKGMPLNRAVKTIMGQPGQEVVLTIKREGRAEEFDVAIKRGRIEVESVLGYRRKADDSWDFLVDHKNKIGYIRLTSFARTSYRDMEAVMKELVRKEEIKGFVLDLRGNPGGLLDQAIKITDLFIADGVIVGIRERGNAESEERFKGRFDGSLLGFPMVCLINGGSASGSEIVSAALQDHERARIIGERSYGKGSVQKLFEVEVEDPKTGVKQAAEIKMTTATFWRPSGKNLNKASTSGKDEDTWGVTPDTVIKLGRKETRDLYEAQRNSETIERPDRKGKTVNEFKDRQLEFALEYLRGQIKLAGKAPAGRGPGG